LKHRRSIYAICLSAFASTAFCQEPSEAQLLAGSGIGKLIARAGHCGYELDDDALQQYYEKQGLATPQVLAWVSVEASIESANLAGLAPGECSVSKATARSMGVLKK
jgi:hypothetical protein